MGDAKRRGTREERVAQAMTRKALAAGAATTRRFGNALSTLAAASAVAVGAMNEFNKAAKTIQRPPHKARSKKFP